MISPDAAHLHSKYKEPFYIYSELTGANKIFMYAFGIVIGNEDYATWMLFNKWFSQSCPSVSHFQPGQKYSEFVFILDCDKGSEQSLC